MFCNNARLSFFLPKRCSRSRLKKAASALGSGQIKNRFRLHPISGGSRRLRNTAFLIILKSLDPDGIRSRNSDPEGHRTWVQHGSKHCLRLLCRDSNSRQKTSRLKLKKQGSSWFDSPYFWPRSDQISIPDRCADDEIYVSYVKKKIKPRYRSTTSKKRGAAQGLQSKAKKVALLHGTNS